MLTVFYCLCLEFLRQEQLTRNEREGTDPEDDMDAQADKTQDKDSEQVNKRKRPATRAFKSTQKLREEALENTYKNAENMTAQMKAKKRKVQPNLKVGDIVLVSIPEHDQTPMSP